MHPSTSNAFDTCCPILTDDIRNRRGSDLPMVNADSARTTDNLRPMVAARVKDVCHQMATVADGHSFRLMTLVDASASGIRANGMNLHTFLHSPYGLRDVLAQPHWERTHSGNTPRDVTHPPSYVLAQPQ